MQLPLHGSLQQLLVLLKCLQLPLLRHLLLHMQEPLLRQQRRIQ